MYGALPSFVFGFHGCDKSVGLNIINGSIDLEPSTNTWDWLGSGSYFWEHDPDLALEYAKNVANGTQYAKGKIKDPFVLGAVINLKNCLNLPSTGGVNILKKGHNALIETIKASEGVVPINVDNKRLLDWAVVEYIHGSNKMADAPSYDTVRGAFPEGDFIYEGGSLTEKNHIQICVKSPECIIGYFLPRPIHKYNPHY